MGVRNRVGIGLSYWPPGNIGWRNSFLGIYSWAPKTFKNTVSVSSNGTWGRLVKFFYFTVYCPPKNLTWLHRSESELFKMHALLNWAIAMSGVRTLFFDNSLIALHSFSFTQKIKDHSSLLSVRSVDKSDVPSSVRASTPTLTYEHVPLIAVVSRVRASTPTLTYEHVPLISADPKGPGPSLWSITRAQDS